MASFLTWAESKDPVIYQYIEKVFVQRSHPEQACRSCGGIQRLGKIYGIERLKSACLRAISFEQYGYKILESILKQNLDQQHLQQDELKLPLHENLRGPAYYR
jgi:hypothetical protein